MSFSSALFSHNVCFTNQNTNLNKLNNNNNKLTTKRPTVSAAFSTDTLDPQTLAVIGTTTAAAVAAAIYTTDPEKRRQLQASEVGGGDKEVVKEYFTNDGFQRWKKIYGDGDDVNKVQLDIRIGHAKTVESVMKMLLDEGELKGVTVCPNKT
ncbi:magnesium protoporphyrin IX methyltransferase, chloroplastic [Tanacetum coccineum]